MGKTKLQEFEPLFREYFKPLCGFATKYVNDLDDAKNLVHEVFISLWEKFEALPPETNYRSYLYTSVKNRCLNFIRDQKKVIALEDQPNPPSQEDHSEMELEELQREVELAINTLPEKCRIVFELSRYEDLKYSEIAEKLGISVKTVEGRMTKALSLLRDSLSQFITVGIFLLNAQGWNTFFGL